MTPSTFTDDGEEYKADWNSNSAAYVVTDEEVTDEEIDVKYTEEYYEKYNEYMADEKDTLKTLIKNMIAYTADCYGIYGNPKTITLDDGSTMQSCEGIGGEVFSIPEKGENVLMHCHIMNMAFGNFIQVDGLMIIVSYIIKYYRF